VSYKSPVCILLPCVGDGSVCGFYLTSQCPYWRCLYCKWWHGSCGRAYKGRVANSL